MDFGISTCCFGTTPLTLDLLDRLRRAKVSITFDRIREFGTAGQIPDLGICYDTGHGEMDGPADAMHHEARNSIEEFRLRYKLPAPRREDEE